MNGKKDDNTHSDEAIGLYTAFLFYFAIVANVRTSVQPVTAKSVRLLRCYRRWRGKVTVPVSNAWFAKGVALASFSFSGISSFKLYRYRVSQPPAQSLLFLQS